MIFILFILGVLYLQAFGSAGDWWQMPRSEDSEYYYYVGSAEGKRALSVLQDDAAAKAMGELVREHFGVRIQIEETSVENLRKQNLHVVTKQASAPMFIKGVAVQKTREVDLDEKGTRIYVQLRASKAAVAEALKFHESKPGYDSINTFGDKHDSKVDLTVKTSPSGCLIRLIHTERSFSIQGQGDARFYLPRGRYEVLVTYPGFKDEKREIRVEDPNEEESFILKQLNGTLNLEVYPEDAKVHFEGQDVTSESLKLQTGIEHHLKVSHGDYYPKDIRVVLKDEYPVQKTIRLEPKPGILTYEISPSHAEVLVDGFKVHVNEGKIRVESGRRNIQIFARDYFPFTETVYVGPNREYPKKKIRLLFDDKTLAPSDKGFAFRLELNPLVSVMNKTEVFIVSPALHFEYKYFSIGGGYNWNQTEEEDPETAVKTKREFKDYYGTIRLILPRIWRIKLYAAGTYGQYHGSKRDSLDRVFWSEIRTYTGLGGGLRGNITPSWSVHAEYFDVRSQNIKSKNFFRENRLVVGAAYEF